VYGREYAANLLNVQVLANIHAHLLEDKTTQTVSDQRQFAVGWQRAQEVYKMIGLTLDSWIIYDKYLLEVMFE